MRVPNRYYTQSIKIAKAAFTLANSNTVGINASFPIRNANGKVKACNSNAKGMFRCCYKSCHLAVGMIFELVDKPLVSVA